MGEDPNPRWRRRAFGEGNSARHVIAETLARRAYPPRDYIAPGEWAEAGALVRELRAAGFRLRRAQK